MYASMRNTNSQSNHWWYGTGLEFDLKKCTIHRLFVYQISYIKHYALHCFYIFNNHVNIMPPCNSPTAIKMDDTYTSNFDQGTNTSHYNGSLHRSPPCSNEAGTPKALQRHKLLEIINGQCRPPEDFTKHGQSNTVGVTNIDPNSTTTRPRLTT